ncbi:DUF2177 family protein [Blastomonas aquatica]|uniref:Membrane protein n=1 Tax=Blastomonas aquatica TaxID=1510276 RepID=A0ABQ1JR84_9SPHN|nr:DUF2177 family protein [Blastomonas aquatica]GGB74787.1 membrane protein [Blastomonas aquatica]
MLRYAAAYLFTGLAFVLIDSVWLKTMAPRLYQPILGDMLAPSFRLVPAVVFYVFYILGIQIFAVAPALADGRWQTALVNGAMLGFFCYMTYDLTNQATLAVWSTKITVLDILWGTFLTGSSGLAGFVVTRAIWK